MFFIVFHLDKHLSRPHYLLSSSLSLQTGPFWISMHFPSFHPLTSGGPWILIPMRETVLFFTVKLENTPKELKTDKHFFFGGGAFRSITCIFIFIILHSCKAGEPHRFCATQRQSPCLWPEHKKKKKKPDPNHPRGAHIFHFVFYGQPAVLMQSGEERPVIYQASTLTALWESGSQRKEPLLLLVGGDDKDGGGRGRGRGRRWDDTMRSVVKERGGRVGRPLKPLDSLFPSPSAAAPSSCNKSCWRPIIVLSAHFFFSPPPFFFSNVLI